MQDVEMAKDILSIKFRLHRLSNTLQLSMKYKPDPI